MRTTDVLYVVDLDGTILDNRPRLKKAGPEPSRSDLSAYLRWLDVLMDHEVLPQDKALPGMRNLVWALWSAMQQEGSRDKVIYLTARNEALREVTSKWLGTQGFPTLDLFMRGADDVQSDYTLKRSLIRSFSTGNVVIIDDDPSGNLARICREEGWTMLKATTCLPD